MKYGWLAATKSALDFLIGVVLAQSVDSPNSSRDPSDESDLEDETQETSHGASDGEEGKPGEKERDDESHGEALDSKFVSF